MPPFVVFALPRSRTAWLSRFLTYRASYCGHDESRYFRDLGDVKAWFKQDNTGSAETGSAPWWRLALRYRPDLRVVVIRRSVPEVVDSLMAVDLHGSGSFNRATLAERMMRMDAKLDQIEHRVPSAMSVKFDDLANQETCKSIFEHCLPYPFDAAWWREMDAINVQCSMPGLVRYASAYKPQIDKMAALATQAILSGFAGRETVDSDGVTIKQEPFDTFLRDGPSLFAEHSSQVGESPGSFQEKNIPLMRTLERAGVLQVRTARSNGRMFGYLMTILAPSLEYRNVKSAIHTAFFASSAIPGIGQKIQRAALRDLRSQGVDEVFWRAGPRGSGPRIGALYRRLGATPDGELYRMNLQET